MRREVVSGAIFVYISGRVKCWTHTTRGRAARTGITPVAHSHSSGSLAMSRFFLPPSRRAELKASKDKMTRIVK